MHTSAEHCNVWQVRDYTLLRATTHFCMDLPIHTSKIDRHFLYSKKRTEKASETTLCTFTRMKKMDGPLVTHYCIFTMKYYYILVKVGGCLLPSRRLQIACCLLLLNTLSTTPPGWEVGRLASQRRVMQYWSTMHCDIVLYTQAYWPYHHCILELITK
jgi:hypothetical protein